MTPLAHWVHDLSPFVPFLKFSETFGVRWYGLAYVTGFVGAAWLFKLAAQKGRTTLPADKNWDLIVALVIGVMLGGRLGSFVFYHPEELIENPLSFFRVWEGGMASHGGFIGLGVAIAWFARSHKIPFLHLSDLVVSAGPLGLFLGRVANFINGELWGKVADVPWAVIFPQSPWPVQPRHPSQLYEALFEGLFLLAYGQHRLWRNKVVQETPGQLTGEFLIGYALARIVCEHFREPDASLILGMSRGQFYSLFMLVAGVVFIVVSRRLAARKKSAPAAPAPSA